MNSMFLVQHEPWIIASRLLNSAPMRNTHRQCASEVLSSLQHSFSAQASRAPMLTFIDDARRSLRPAHGTRRFGHLIPIGEISPQRRQFCAIQFLIENHLGGAPSARA